MKTKIIAVCAMGIFAILLTSIANAGTLVVNYDNGQTQLTSGISNAQTDGDEMVGMKVVATFSDNTTETLFWAATVADTGGVTGNGWSLIQSGDTFNDISPWILTSTSKIIKSFFIDAGLGDTVFDTDGVAVLSPNSALGKQFKFDPFAPTAHTDWDVTATYSDIVQVGGTIYGDLYRNLNISFDNSFFAPTTAPAVLSFIADTDNLEISGDINSVPEPATMLLLGTGLVGVAGAARRKQKKQT
jgi:hypothetical protein